MQFENCGREFILLPSMKNTTRTDMKISYQWNGKDGSERLNRVYDMLFEKVIQKLNENAYGKQSRSCEVKV
jgi:hypothetical protein